MPELTPEQKAQLDKNIRGMLSQGASQEDVMTYSKDFRTKYDVAIVEPTVKKKEQSLDLSNIAKPTSPTNGLSPETIATAIRPQDEKINKVVNHPEFDKSDPVKSILEPIRPDLTKIVNKPLPSSSTAIKKPVGIVTPKETVQDFQHFNNVREYLKQTIAPTAQQAKQVMANIPDVNNHTYQLAKEKADEYDNTVKGVEQSNSLEDYALKRFREDNPQVDDKLKYIESQHPNEQLGWQDLLGKDGDRTMGRLMKGYVLSDPNIKEYVNTPQVNKLGGSKNLYEDEYNNVKNNYADIYPDAAINDIANKLSKERQKRGMNSYVATFNDKSFNNGTDKLAEEILTPKEKELYDAKMKGNLKQYIDVPGALNRLSGGIEQGLHGWEENMSNQTKEHGFQEEINKGNVSAGEKGLYKFIGDVSNMTGYVMEVGAELSLGGGALKGFGVPEKMADKTMVFSHFFGEGLKEGSDRFPNDPLKAYASGLANALGITMLPDIVPAAKLNKAIGAAKQGITESLGQIGDAEISSAAVSDATANGFSKAFDYLKDAGNQHAKSIAEMYAYNKFKQLVDAGLGSPHEHTGQEDEDVIKAIGIGNIGVSLVGGYGDYAKRSYTKDAVWDFANNPNRGINATNDSNLSPEMKADITDKITRLKNTKDVLDANDVPEKQQKTYLLHDLNESSLTKKVADIQAKAASIQDQTLAQKELDKIPELQKHIEESQKVKEKILSGKPVENDLALPQDEVPPEKPEVPLTPEQVIIDEAKKNTLAGGYSGLINADPTRAKEVLLDYAKQKYGLGDDGSDRTGGGQEITNKEVDAAVSKSFPDKETTIAAIKASQPEDISQPIESDYKGQHILAENKTTADKLSDGGTGFEWDKVAEDHDLTDKATKESYRVLKTIKDNPDAEVTIYRSVPEGVDKINEGDWVTLSATYAKEHGMHETDPTKDMPVISMKVKAKDIVWDGNDLNEFAYKPKEAQLSGNKGGDVVDEKITNQSEIDKAVTHNSDIEKQKQKVIDDHNVEVDRLKKESEDSGKNINKPEKFDAKETHYSPVPQDGVFNLASASKEKRSYDAYKVDINGDEGRISFIQDPKIIKAALDSSSAYIDPVASPTADSSNFGKANDIEILKPGKIKKEGDKWVVKEKMIIRLLPKIEGAKSGLKNGEVIDNSQKIKELEQQRDAKLSDLEKQKQEVPEPIKSKTSAAAVGGGDKSVGEKYILEEKELSSGVDVVKSTIEKGYPNVTDKVDGRVVREGVPNMGSIEASLGEHQILSGIKEVPMSEFDMGEIKYGTKAQEQRSKELADEIKESGEISPLIVVVDKDGPYILEGATRFDALRELGAKSFPAKVVIDLESIRENKTNVNEQPKNENTSNTPDKGSDQQGDQSTTPEVKPVEPPPEDKQGTGEPPKEGEGIGIAHTSQENRASKLGQEKPVRGEGVTTEESIQHGKDLLEKGGDAEKELADFQKDKKISYDGISLVRAKLNDLAKKTNKAIDKFGDNSPEAKVAKEAEGTWRKAIKPMQTEWAKIGQGQQGEVDIDTGSVIGLRRAFQDTYGKDPNPRQEKVIKDLADKVKGLDNEVQDLKAKLTEALNNDEKMPPKNIKEKAKQFADSIRKLKTHRPDTFSAGTPASIVWDGAVEVAAKIVEAGGDIADAIAKGIEHIKGTDWYANLSESKKDAAEKSFKDSLSDKDEERRIRALEKQLEDLQQGKVKSKPTKRELSDKEKELKEQIFEAKKNLGLIPSKELPKVKVDKTKEQQKLERLQKELDDVRNGIIKQKSEPSEDSPEVKDLKEQLFEAKKNAGLIPSKELSEQDKLDIIEKETEQLATQFADKNDTKFTPEQARDIWNYAKSEYLDKDVDYNDMVSGVSMDLGLTPKQVRFALETPQAAKKITNEMYRRQYQRRIAQQKAAAFVKTANRPAIVKFLKFLPSFFFKLKTFGHGTVGFITHAGNHIFKPTTWKLYWPNFFKQFKYAYGDTAGYEKEISDLVRDKDFIFWKRNGLGIDPTKIYDDYQMGNNFFGKLGRAGDRGFDALKVFRLDLAKYLYNQRSALEKADPETAKEIAKMVNHSTGTSKVPVPENTSAFVFAPRLEFSRWSRIITEPFKAVKTFSNWKNATAAEKAAAKIVVKRSGETIATYMTLLAANQGLLLATGSSQRINFLNPNQSDWLKFKFGGKTLDMTGGMLSSLRLVADLVNDATTSQKNLHGKGRFEAMKSRLGDYGSGKLSPFASTVKDVLTQHDFLGNVMPFSNDEPGKGKHKLTWWEYLLKQQTPIPVSEAINDMANQMKERGMSTPDINIVLSGALVGLISGGTGARVGDELHPQKQSQGNTTTNSSHRK